MPMGGRGMADGKIIENAMPHHQIFTKALV
jgi:hypothetical protein